MIGLLVLVAAALARSRARPVYATPGGGWSCLPALVHFVEAPWPEGAPLDPVEVVLRLHNRRDGPRHPGRVGRPGRARLRRGRPRGRAELVFSPRA